MEVDLVGVCVCAGVCTTCGVAVGPGVGVMVGSGVGSAFARARACVCCVYNVYSCVLFFNAYHSMCCFVVCLCVFVSLLV